MSDPKFRVEFSGTARIEVKVDLAAYYAEFTEKQRADYISWDDPEGTTDLENEPWTKPVAYLSERIYDNTEVLSGLASRHVSDWSDIDDWDSPRVWERPYEPTGSKSSQWTEQDFDALLAAVPWMQVASEVDDEARAEIERCAPHLWDVPLFAMDGAK